MVDEDDAALRPRAELEANLAEYEGQLAQVETLLLDEPDNSEYADIYKSLTEVIALTRDLLADAADTGGEAAVAPAEPPQPAPPATDSQQQPRKRKSRWDAPAADAGAGAAPSRWDAPAAPPPPSQPTTSLPAETSTATLPPAMAAQIKAAQANAALTGAAPAAWAVGSRCVALHPLDGARRPGVVLGAPPTGGFVVRFDPPLDDQHVVGREGVGPAGEGGGGGTGATAGPADEEEAYQGVSAPKRGRVAAAPTPAAADMPKWMEMKEGDDERTRAKKAKLQKAWKGRQRFAAMDTAQAAKQASWQAFKGGKGAKKRAGFMSTTARKSMFAVPDNPNARVGVVGSGQGMTAFVAPKTRPVVGGMGMGEGGEGEEE